MQRFLGGMKGVFFVIAVAISLFLHLYTQHVVNQLRDEARSLVLIYAQMYAKIAETESPDDISFLFNQIILNTSFPLIQTDPDNNPIGWKGINVDPNDRSEEALNKVRRLIEQMDKEIEPVPVRYQGTLFNYLHYGDSRLISQLQWLPYIEIGIIGMFILLGFVGYATIKRGEQRNIWVGMAKETAHQLGTPLSSLLGWLEVMRSGRRSNQKEILDEMESDLLRLQLVTNRFSQIGSKPDLKEVDLPVMLEEVVEYIRRRAPQLGRSVNIEEHYKDSPKVGLNAGLFKWALENILKNSLDAMDKEKGRILVRCGPAEGKLSAYIEIEDNGKGIDPSQWRRIFKPGFSTKTRGWGLGLSLAKRIIEEYHGGKLFLKDSRSGEGSIMRIEL